jgi:aminoglycoside 2''-phosphotransferase
LNSKELKYMELINSRFPQLDLSKIEFNKTDGSYSDIAIINNEVVFKFAKYDWSAVYLINEADFIRFIRDFITLPLPDVELIAPNVSIHHFIKGSPLYRNILLKSDYNTQDTVARQIATFLNQLHNIPVKKAQYAKIENSQMNRTREDWLYELETMQRKISPYCTDYVKEYLHQIIQPVIDNKEFFEFRPVLIHGDLTPYHILFDKASRQISSIIGFGNAGFGDPAFDFGMLLDHLGESFIKRIQKYYPISPEYLDRARFYAYISSFMWLRDVCDMITTRDFSRFQIPAKDRDISPLSISSPSAGFKPSKK